jgi:Tol biopolymer transport system component
MDATGGAPWRVTASDRHELFCDWSRDGQWLYFSAARDSTWQIYRKRPNGTEEQQITVAGGIVAQESLDCERLYFTKPSDIGLWRIPVAGGEETRVIEGLMPRDRGTWDAHASGIYYVQRTEQEAFLCRFDVARDEISILTPVSNIAGSSLAISPDGQTILYSRHEQREGDLVYVRHLLLPSNNLP